MKSVTVISRAPRETVAWGKRLGEQLGPGDVVGLVGELGSGKTTFVKGLARGLGVKRPLAVNSPTFIIFREYRGRCPLYHCDPYRLDDPVDDFREIGYEEYFYGDGVTVIEWAGRLKGLLPPTWCEVQLSFRGPAAAAVGRRTTALGPASRTLSFIPHGQRFRNVIAHVGGTYRREISSGGVIYRERQGDIQVCLIARFAAQTQGAKRRTQIWCLPKGKVERGEKPAVTAIREVQEETGLEGEVVRRLKPIHYWYYDRKAKANVDKTVSFYLVRYRRGKTSDHDHEVTAARWFSLVEAAERLVYPTERRVLQQATRFLRGRNGKTA